MGNTTKQQPDARHSLGQPRNQEVIDPGLPAIEADADRLDARPLAGVSEGAPPLLALAPAQRHQTILALQRLHGNGFVQRLLPNSSQGSRDQAATVQRASPAAKQQIAAALKSKEPADVRYIMDIDQATETEKIELIRILVDQSWVGPRDETLIEQLWQSFDDQLPRVMAANKALWNDCIEAGAELDELPAVARLRDLFPKDIKAIVAGYLKDNQQFVEAEIERLGIAVDTSGAIAGATPDQAAETRQMQATAAAIAKLQAAQEAARNTYVGYDLEFYDLPPLFPSNVGEPDARRAADQRYEPVLFNPYTGKPPHEKAPPGSLFRPVAPLEPGARFARYDDLKAHYDKADDLITKLLERNPILYAVSREGKSATTAAFAGMADSVAAREQLAIAIWRLLTDIAQTRTKLFEGDLDPLDLTPVHAQLFGGVVSAPSGTAWGEPLPRSIAEDLVKDHNFQNFLIALGLQTAAAALFALAPLTGGASLYLALAGLAVTGAKLAMSAEQYETLAQASKTSVKPGTELVGGGQVESAQLTMEADQLALALAVLAVGTIAAAKLIGAITAPPPVKQGTTVGPPQQQAVTPGKATAQDQPPAGQQPAQGQGQAHPRKPVRRPLPKPQDRGQPDADQARKRPTPKRRPLPKAVVREKPKRSREDLLKQAGEPSRATTWRPEELPYTPPPGMQIVEPGKPLDLSKLDPNQRYIWVLDADGKHRFAPEAQGTFYPKRYKLEASEPGAGQSPAKHGDLVAPEAGAIFRGPARGGGELVAEQGPDGKPTGKWIMNNDSSYTFNREDDKHTGAAELQAAYELLGQSGTDVSKIVPRNTHGHDAAPGR